MEKPDNTIKDYVPFDINDIDTAGAKNVIEAEEARLMKKPGRNPDQPLSGIAISGGGIRSASFALGVIQALAWRGALSKFDYLSTVSGGGYIGSSLTWFLHKAWKVPARDETHDMPKCCQAEKDYIRFGTDGACFPYGVKERLSEPDDPGGVRAKSAVLRHLRQNASYLNPGHGITGASLFAIILRGMLVSAAVYFPILLLGIYLLTHYGALPPYKAGESIMNPLLYLVLSIGSLFVASAFVYAVATHYSRIGNAFWYYLRRGYEAVAGVTLVVIAGLVIVGLLPWITAKGMPYLLGWLSSDPDQATQLSALVSTVAGALLGGKAYQQSEAQAEGKISVDLLAGLGATLLAYGLLIAAYSIAIHIGNANTLYMGIVACLAIGWITNVNFLSIHRYYRDRLMETFMPGVPEVFQSKTGPSPDANKGYLSDMCNYAEAGTVSSADDSTGPYHIINTNLILVNSKIKKFRSRGGDSFVLSPLYCGSNATGWEDTKKIIDGKLTLATAMAISGAAANPNSGPSGTGASRGKAVSFLMTLLNLRLGYWLPNPGKKSHFGAKPNMIQPGIDALFSVELNETNPFVQLSDGGHFENLALYELIRRRVKIIVCTDGGADKGFSFSDFANMTEKVRVDFGVAITGIAAEQDERKNWITTQLDLSDLVPKETYTDAHGHKIAKAGHLLCGIRYPGDPEGEASGLMIYIKTTWLKDLPADIVGYKNDHPEFPDQSTADQFFDERQFEAYRELGYQTAQRVFEDKIVETLTCIKAEVSSAIITTRRTGGMMKAPGRGYC